MKRGRKLTVAECNHVKSFRLKPENWLICKKLADKWQIVNRQTNKPRIIPAP